MKNYLEKIADILECEAKHVKVDVFRDQMCRSSRLFLVKLKNKEVARFNLAQLHGCCGVSLSYHAHVSFGFRGRGLGTLLNKMREQIAVNLGYSFILCTDVANNKPQSKILKNNGWKTLAKFKNRRTGHLVNISAKKLGNRMNDLGFDTQPRRRRCLSHVI